MTDTVVDGLMAEVDAMLAAYEERRTALLEKLRPQFQSIFQPFFEACGAARLSVLVLFREFACLPYRADQREDQTQ